MSIWTNNFGKDTSSMNSIRKEAEGRYFFSKYGMVK